MAKWERKNGVSFRFLNRLMVKLLYIIYKLILGMFVHIILLKLTPISAHVSHYFDNLFTRSF